MTNVVVIDGNLGKDGEIRTFPSGKTVVKFSVAVKQGKDKPTLWLPVEAWEQPDFILDSLKKGKHVIVTGQLSLNQYTTNDGEVRKEIFIGFAKIDLGRDSLGDGPRTKTKTQMKQQAISEGDFLTEDDIPF